MTISSIATQGVAYPQVTAIAQVYEKYVNDRGGIAGHPLKVEVCDQKVDPNAAAACARRAVSDKVIAVIGSYSTYTPQIIPLLKQNNIAWWGPAAPSTPADLTSSNSFAFVAQPAVLSAPSYQAYKDGCRKIGFIVSSAAVQPYLIASALGGLKAAGGSQFKVTVKAPVTTGDLSSQAAQLTSGTDCIVGIIGSETWAALLPALNQSGKTPRLYGPTGAFTPALVAQFQKTTENASIASASADLSSPAYAQLRAAIKQYSPPSSFDYNSIDLVTWAAYVAFNQVVTSMKGDITAQTFLTAAQQAKLKFNGMLPDEDLAVPGLSPNYVRMFTNSVTFSHVSNGKVVAGDGKFTDLSAVLAK